MRRAVLAPNQSFFQRSLSVRAHVAKLVLSLGSTPDHAHDRIKADAAICIAHR
jgi:hypothetical protein